MVKTLDDKSQEKINEYIKEKSVFDLADDLMELGSYTMFDEILEFPKNLKEKYKNIPLNNRNEFDHFCNNIRKKMEELEKARKKVGKLVKYPELNGYYISEEDRNPSHTEYELCRWAGIYGKPLLGFKGQSLVYLLTRNTNEKLIICGTREKRFFGEKIRLIPKEDREIVKERLLSRTSESKDSRSDFEKIEFWDEENHSAENAYIISDTYQNRYSY